MKTILSRSKSLSDWHCAVAHQGVLVGYWSEKSLAWKALFFRRGEVGSEIGVNGRLLLGRKEEKKKKKPNSR